MLSIAFELVVDVLRFVGLGLRSHARLAAENLFLRKQLALYFEREAKPRRASNATRLTLVVLARFIEWRAVLTIVQPDTLVRWHRHAFRLFWRWTSRRRGRPRIPETPSAPDRGDGDRESDLGRGAHRRGTAGQARDLRFSADHPTLHAAIVSLSSGSAVAGMEHLRAESRARGAGLRFLRDRHRGVPNCLRVRGPRHRNAPHHPLEHHDTSDRRMDGSAVPRVHHRRPAAPIPHPRPRPHLFQGSGPGVDGHGPANSQNAHCRTSGERVPRTRDRYRSPRVPRLRDSPERAASAQDRHGMGRPLQSRSPTHESRSWDSRRATGRHLRQGSRFTRGTPWHPTAAWVGAAVPTCVPPRAHTISWCTVATASPRVGGLHYIEVDSTQGTQGLGAEFRPRRRRSKSRSAAISFATHIVSPQKRCRKAFTTSTGSMSSRVK